jgi:NitT/TauT family transport system ATP-binding protein
MSADGPRRGSAVGLQELTVVYDTREMLAVDNLSLEIAAGEFVCLLGPTGCGKSTILAVIAGFIAPTKGKVLVGGEPIDGPSPSRGIVPQNLALFPWATAAGNVAFGPRVRGYPKATAERIAYEHLDLVGLADSAAAYPHELSGGMQQRVALARALANEPSLLLMDEPFGALDAETRVEMQELLLRLWSAAGWTVIFVTHDIDEAILLGDRIVILTARPARPQADLAVGFGRPRSYELLSSMEYLEIKRTVVGLIREEARRGVAGEHNGGKVAP